MAQVTVDTLPTDFRLAGYSVAGQFRPSKAVTHANVPDRQGALARALGAKLKTFYMIDNATTVGNIPDTLDASHARVREPLPSPIIRPHSRALLHRFVVTASVASLLENPST